MQKSILLKSMQKNNFLLATLFTILFALSLSTARAASAPTQNITVTVANITNKDLMVEIAQKNRCAKIVQQIKAYDNANPAKLTPIKLTCPLDGIIIKGIPAEIWMTVNSPQDLNLLLELGKDMQTVIATYFPASDTQKWSDNLARAQKNLSTLTKIIQLTKERDELAAINNGDQIVEFFNKHVLWRPATFITYFEWSSKKTKEDLLASGYKDSEIGWHYCDGQKWGNKVLDCKVAVEKYDELLKELQKQGKIGDPNRVWRLTLYELAREFIYQRELQKLPPLEYPQ